MAVFGLGLRTIRAYCRDQNPAEWRKAKLSAEMFKQADVAIFNWVEEHVRKYHALPQLVTLEAKCPEALGVDTPEPGKYYADQLEDVYYARLLSEANVDSQKVLKDNQHDHQKAIDLLQSAINCIKKNKFRAKMLDVGKETPKLVTSAYHAKALQENVARFGWPYMDTQGGGIMSGDIVSYVGRPATGKSFFMLYSALHNWLLGKNVLFVSMEMTLLPIAQRIAAMYTGVNIGQLKSMGFSKSTYDLFVKKLHGMQGEKAHFYIVDGNLAANMEDIYALAEQLQCQIVVIDGAYLVQHQNTRLDRYTKVAENCTLMKRYNGEDLCTFASWQFSKDAEKMSKKGAKQEVGLAEIGYSDAIAQISSFVLGLFQPDSIETMQKREIKVMKGREGEVGQFSVAWDFWAMNFGQVDPPTNSSGSVEEEELQYL